MQSKYKGQFEVVDGNGKKLAEGFERPGMPCYISARIPGIEPGTLIDAFGDNADTLEEGKRRVREFFERHGIVVEE